MRSLYFVISGSAIWQLYPGVAQWVRPSSTLCLIPVTTYTYKEWINYMLIVTCRVLTKNAPVGSNSCILGLQWWPCIWGGLEAEEACASLNSLWEFRTLCYVLFPLRHACLKMCVLSFLFLMPSLLNCKPKSTHSPLNCHCLGHFIPATER